MAGPPALRRAVTAGLVWGAAAVFVSLAGMVEMMHARAILSGVVSLGQGLLLLAVFGSGYTAARAARARGGAGLLAGGLAGCAAAVPVAVLVLAGERVNLRTMFVNASPALFRILTFDRGAAAVWAIPILGAVAGGLGAAAVVVPAVWRRPVSWGVASVLVLSIFQELIQLILQSEGLPALVREFLYAPDGPSVPGGTAAFLGTAAAAGIWPRVSGPAQARVRKMPPVGRGLVRAALLGAGLLALLLVPVAGGPFVAQVIVIVGLYTLMGLGLNLEVGLAGLLDLGFVAFFAIGAYTVGLLTSTGPLGIARWSFWAAVPVAVAVSLVAGVILGIPVLGIRGDYLAIATLGFGEITRLLVLSDFLRPWLGGSQGVLAIPKPHIGPYELSGPQHLFYVTLVGSALVAYVAWRLERSRLGRAWMAIREDEDVAEALGVNLVQVKLLAYGLGAAFAGVAGAIFAVMVGSVFPHSFQLLISINVLALIIVGGLGSTPGVVVGSLALVGLPELLREFGEFRFLVYGAVLVAMMLLRPEGLLPAAAQRRELREAAETEPAVPAALPVAARAEGRVEVDG
ncbi:MAG: branched-chain amino acid ABC transporter permease [Armatimonadota bacterium]|nr:branched-chain amino acid ABC transporter permease [Armatimonadota bacterium]MDR7506828.1 branched-chain amino acid ABC transporter permease [Armatimonadota bacterium]MDR7509257.1 branched-chain amino acid ABC transporter permease [Armatimonadota bacterium]MDR7517504.1 branched-chain amino acid ABC transporter permease [Armatimonadota bacterium]MDR7560463.1 branched-chain amino acid ABC transporter permease [Armatimonadota bacterium]